MLIEILRMARRLVSHVRNDEAGNYVMLELVLHVKRLSRCTQVGWTLHVVVTSGGPMVTPAKPRLRESAASRFDYNNW